MAKVTSFADKAAKLARKDAEVLCPKCNKSAKMTYVKMVTSVKSNKDSYKYLEKNMRLCSNCLEEV
jgi:hypothetical protein